MMTSVLPWDEPFARYFYVFALAVPAEGVPVVALRIRSETPPCTIKLILGSGMPFGKGQITHAEVTFTRTNGVKASADAFHFTILVVDELSDASVAVRLVNTLQATIVNLTRFV